MQVVEVGSLHFQSIQLAFFSSPAGFTTRSGDANRSRFGRLESVCQKRFVGGKEKEEKDRWREKLLISPSPLPHPPFD